MTDSTRKNSSPAVDSTTEGSAANAYWRANLRILRVLLGVWFVAAFVLGILAVDVLNQFHLGGFPLGFWFAQQGSILIFVGVIFFYARYMDRLEGGGEE